MYLVTYVCESRGNTTMGHYVTNDPVEWIIKMQGYKETFFIVNVLPISDEEAKKIDGELKGM